MIDTIAVYDNGKIARVYETSDGLDGVRIAMENEGLSGTLVIVADLPVREGDACWNLLGDGSLQRLTDAEMVALGRVTLAANEVLDGDSIRKMTEVEKIDAGLSELPAGYKIEDGALVEKTDADVYADDPTDWKEARCDEVDAELQRKLKAGFLYGPNTIQADPVALQNANGFLTAIAADMPFKTIRWRTAENADILFDTAQEFMAFAVAMMDFVQASYATVWAAKDAIRAAGTYQEASTAFSGYVA